jgi:hypothetical protein
MNRRTNKKHRHSNRHTRRRGGGIDDTIREIQKYIHQSQPITVIFLQNNLESTSDEISCVSYVLNELRGITYPKNTTIDLIVKGALPKKLKTPIEDIERKKTVTLKKIDRDTIHDLGNHLMTSPSPNIRIMISTMSELRTGLREFLRQIARRSQNFPIIIPCGVLPNASEFRSILSNNAPVASVAASVAASSNKLDPARGCNVCGKTPESIGKKHHSRCVLCDRNSARRYCSEDCQRKNWENGHKLVHRNNSNQKSNE